jgi:eukaryotic-like serine/threonine-protein kinase
VNALPEIAGYTDLVPIGRGGLGDVYSAVQTMTGADVAIKVLRDVSDTSVAWHRTRRELTALLALSGHANVVQIVEVLDLPSGPALVMELAPGGSVADVMQRRDGTLTVHETVFVGRQTAAALVSAHARGIVHRDIKPQNLLIDADGQVQLCDFGIAALTRDEHYRSRTSAISMRYASPEDLEHEPGDRDGDDLDAVGPSSDVYSLGATLLHLARGAPPTLKERLAPWVPPDDADAPLAALDRVLARCLHPTPTMRPTAQALLDALDGLALGAGPDRVTALVAAAEPAVTPLAPSMRVTGPTPPPAATPPAERFAVQHDDLFGGDDITVVPSRPVAADTVSAQPLQRPDPPRPIPTGRRRRWPIIAGVAVVAAAAAAFVLWPDDAEAPDAAATTTVVQTTVPATTVPPTTVPPTTVPTPITLPRPLDLPPLTDAVWSTGVVGDCLLQVAGAADLVVVACDQAHDLQRYAAGDVTALGIAGFNADALAAGVDAECRARFTEFVGTDPSASTLRYAQTLPNADTWSLGDRAYACYVGLADARLTADARATAW